MGQQVEYRDVPGFPGYRVGSDGTVWSCWRLVGRGIGGGVGTRSVMGDTWRLRRAKRSDNDCGHLLLVLRREGQTHYRYVHRLVLEAFVGPCPEGMEACHDDGDPANNRLGNLRWDTPTANGQDRCRHGKQAKGERHGMVKLTREVVLAARARLAGGDSVGEVARSLGVSHACVSDIKARRTWAWLT